MCLVAAKQERDWVKNPPLTNGEQLRFLRESMSKKTGKKVYQRRAAQIAGLNEDDYRAVEYDRRTLKDPEAEKLAAAWGLKSEDFYLREEGYKPAKVDPLVVRERTATPPKPAVPQASILVPFVGPVKAGSWDSPLDSPDEEPIPVDMYAPNVFVSYIVGDSMDDFLQEGDRVVFKTAEAGRALPRDIVMARNSDNDITVKQLMYDGATPYLHPLNKSYSDIFEFDGGWSIVGILVGRIREEDGDTVRRHNAKHLRPK